MSVWTYTLDNEGIATLTIELADEKINKLTPDGMAELSDLISQIRHNTAVKVLFIKSGKPNMFIAGADIAEIQNITSAAEGERKARSGQQVFAALEALHIPTIAIIDGPALGGGLELALACRYRVVTDNPKTQLGLPEVSLGILPGFGGTQRLPRVIGLSAAIDLIVSAKMIDGPKAKKIGLANACYPPAFLDAKIRDLSKAFLADKNPFSEKRNKKYTESLVEKVPPARFLLFKIAKKQIIDRTHGHYPAPLAALNVISETYRQNTEHQYKANNSQLEHLNLL